MAAMSGLRRISSSASLTSALRAEHGVLRIPRRWRGESASALMTCCSASARSASASLSLNSCWVVSNWTTTSPGCDQFAGLAEVGDRHIGAADHGGGEHLGVAALQFAAGGDGEGDAALLDLWWWGVRVRRWRRWHGRGGRRPRRGRRRRRGRRGRSRQCGASFLCILLFGIDQA